MIVASLAHIEEQVVLTPNLECAFTFLKNLDLNRLQEGRQTIDGERVFAILSTYTTKPIQSLVQLEWHRKYLDLQFLAQGEEAVGWAPVEQVPESTPYQPESDAWEGNLPAGSVAWLKLHAGQVAVLYPTDAHAPQHASGVPAPVWKVVVKVSID
jgi:biofilm protein TabA